jgi:hypothetical protein
LNFVVCRKADRVCEEPDPGKLFEVWGGGEHKQACAAVSVHGVGRGRGGRHGCGREDDVADIRGERNEGIVDVLEERTSLTVGM